MHLTLQCKEGNKTIHPDKLSGFQLKLKLWLKKNTLQYGWLRNPINLFVICRTTNLDFIAQEQLMKFNIDRTLQLRHRKWNLKRFVG